MPISFNNISPTVRLPMFYAEVDPSQAGTFSNYQRALIISYKKAGGTGVANAFERIPSLSMAKTKYGRGAPGAMMFESWLDNNGFDEVWGGYVAEPAAGVAATGSIVVTGPATASGVLALYIAGDKVPVNVISGDVSTAVATAIAAAVNANGDLPVTASAAASTVTLTAKWKGVDGNGIDIRHSYFGTLGAESLPAGIGLTITAMASGAGVPDLTALLAALGGQAFDTIVMGWTDTTTLNAIDAFLDHDGDTGRWSWLKMIYGHCYTAADGSSGTLQTLGSNRNGAHVTCFGYNGSPVPCWQRAAMYAAKAHRALMNDPARPLHTLALSGMLAATPDLRFSPAEKNALSFSGVTVCEEDDTGVCLIKTSITMSRLNKYGLADNAFLKVQTLATLTYVLRSLRYRITQKFPRHKLANDGTRYGPGQAIVTPKMAKAEIIGHYRELEFLGLVENADAFEQALIVERNVSDPNRLDVLYGPDLVNQLDIFAVLAQFRLQYPQQLPDRALALV